MLDCLLPLQAAALRVLLRPACCDRPCSRCDAQQLWYAWMRLGTCKSFLSGKCFAREGLTWQCLTWQQKHDLKSILMGTGQLNMDFIPSEVRLSLQNLTAHVILECLLQATELYNGTTTSRTITLSHDQPKRIHCHVSTCQRHAYQSSACL